MRPKVLLSALLGAAVLVGFTVWLTDNRRALPAPAPEPVVVSVARAPAVAPPVSRQEQIITPAHDAPPPAAPYSNSAAGILADLAAPGREAHQDALRRARELDDHSIIPRLRELAARAEDAQDKADLLDTINFLNLPDEADNVAAAKAARASAGLPDLPQSPTNRWTGKPFPAKQ